MATSTNAQQLDFDLMNARRIQGKKDPNKHYTVVEGVVTLPNGMRCFCEAFMNIDKAFAPGPHRLHLELQVNMKRQLEVRAMDCTPVAISAARAAA